MAPVVDDVDEMAEGLKAGRWEMEQGGGGLGEIKRERQRMEKRGGGATPFGIQSFCKRFIRSRRYFTCATLSLSVESGGHR